jgi:hypothetical protein
MDGTENEKKKNRRGDTDTQTVDDLISLLLTATDQVTQASGSLPLAASGVLTSVSAAGLPRLAVDKIFIQGIQVA